MGKQYPSWETYEKLYHRWLYHRDPACLFDIALNIPTSLKRKPNCLAGKRILDICCGTGRLSREALDYGASVVAIDKEPSMLKPTNFDCTDPDKWPLRFFVPDQSTHVTINDNCIAIIEEAAFAFDYAVIKSDPVDLAFCQQAVNYWFDDFALERLAKCIKPEGVFVFSTFNKKTLEIPKVEEYWEYGNHYFETSQLVTIRNTEWVYHTQGCEGLPPHITKFRWIAPDEYDVILSRYFKVKRIREGNTDIYRCEK